MSTSIQSISSGPILESKGICAIFQKKGKKSAKNVKKGQKRAKYSKIWAKNVQNLKLFEKGQVTACNYRTQ